MKICTRKELPRTRQPVVNSAASKQVSNNAVHHLDVRAGPPWRTSTIAGSASTLRRETAPPSTFAKVERLDEDKTITRDAFLNDDIISLAL